MPLEFDRRGRNIFPTHIAISSLEPAQREAPERPGPLAVQESPLGFPGGHLESFQPFFANTRCSDSPIVDVFLANQSIGPQAPTSTIPRLGLARAVLLLQLAHSTVVIEHAHALTTPWANPTMQKGFSSHSCILAISKVYQDLTYDTREQERGNVRVGPSGCTEEGLPIPQHARAGMASTENKGIRNTHIDGHTEAKTFSPPSTVRAHACTHLHPTALGFGVNGTTPFSTSMQFRLITMKDCKNVLSFGIFDGGDRHTHHALEIGRCILPAACSMDSEGQPSKWTLSTMRAGPSMQIFASLSSMHYAHTTCAYDEKFLTRSRALGNNSSYQLDNTLTLLSMSTSANHHNEEVAMVHLHVPAQHQSWLPSVLWLEFELHPTFTLGNTSTETLTHTRQQRRDMSSLNREILPANHMYISGGVSTCNTITWRQPATALSESNPAYPYESTLWLYFALMGVCLLSPARKLPPLTFVVVLTMLLPLLCMTGAMNPTFPFSAMVAIR